VLADVAGKPLIVRMLDRVRRARTLDDVWLATSVDPSDDALADLVTSVGVRVHRGSVDDVLERFRGAASRAGADVVVRLTGDCPLHDPDIIDEAVTFFAARAATLDYVTNAVHPTYPDGLDTEVFTRAALERAAAEATSPVEREHVTLFINRGRNPDGSDRFRVAHVQGTADFSHLRWTVDEPEDLEFVRQVFASLLPDRPTFGWLDVVALLTRRPELLALNRQHRRNEKLVRELEKAGL